MLTHQSAPEEIVIIGGNGKTGRRVAALLRAQGRAVRPVSRSTSPSFDWNETTTWAAALEGASAAYITYSPDLALPGADEQLRQLGRLLAGMDVTRVVLLSGRGEPGAVVSENALREQVPTARVVRSSFFMQNFTEGMLIEFVSDGVIAMPVPGTVPEPFIDVDDVAEVVVATLLDDSKARGILEVTGPASITFTDVAATFSQELGREVAFQEVSPQAFVERWVAAGLHPDEAHGLAEMFEELMDGHNSHLSDGVTSVLGRPAKSFQDFVRDSVSQGLLPIAAGQGGKHHV